jgi:hypothetical protein
MANRVQDGTSYVDVRFQQTSRQDQMGGVRNLAQQLFSMSTGEIPPNFYPETASRLYICHQSDSLRNGGDHSMRPILICYVAGGLRARLLFSLRFDPYSSLH